MKRLLTILFILFYLSSFAQHDRLKLIGLYTTSIVLNGIGDGLNDSGHKTLGHTMTAISIGTLFITPFLVDYKKDKFFYYLATYTCIRFALFDASYNLSRGLPLDYVGVSAPTDKLLNKTSKGVLMGGKVIALTIGIVIPIKEF
jgi:hypothetical protein